MSGLKTFSSKLPEAPPIPTATSLPITWAQTIVSASHWVGLTLPGMIELPGSFSGMRSSPMPLRGPEASQRTSLAILVSARRQRLERPVGDDERVVRGEGLELVGRGDEGTPGQLGDHARPHRSPKPRGRVQAGADRGAAERELAQVRQRRAARARGRGRAG